MSDSVSKSIEDIICYWFVLDPGFWENNEGPTNWFAVANDDESIIAYFCESADAEKYRIAKINEDLVKHGHAVQLRDDGVCTEPLKG